MSRRGRGFAKVPGLGGSGIPPVGLPAGVNPEFLAQMLGGSGAYRPDDETSADCRETTQQDDGKDRSRWKILYPAYINKKRTVAKGRRVGLNIAVEDPTVDEMKMICDHLAVPAHVEHDKRYARDWLLSSGRLRVLLKKDDGGYYCEEAPNKKKLMEKLCQLIPKLKTRSAQPQQQSASSGTCKKKKKR